MTPVQNYAVMALIVAVVSVGCAWLVSGNRTLSPVETALAWLLVVVAGLGFLSCLHLSRLASRRPPEK